MVVQLQVPTSRELEDLDCQVVSAPDEPWITVVTCWAGDGSEVVVSWDKVARSASVRWVAGNGRTCVEMERELEARVSVAGGHTLEFKIEIDVEGLGGGLVVRVDECVSIVDALLRT